MEFGADLGDIWLGGIVIDESMLQEPEPALVSSQAPSSRLSEMSPLGEMSSPLGEMSSPLGEMSSTPGEEAFPALDFGWGGKLETSSLVQYGKRTTRFGDLVTTLDMTPFFGMTQGRVAHLLGCPVSSLSKRWRKASHGKIWPYRKVLYIDQQIASMKRRRVGVKGEKRLQELRREREWLLKPVTIELPRKNGEK